jgi:hypothetical protein
MCDDKVRWPLRLRPGRWSGIDALARCIEDGGTDMSGRHGEILLNEMNGREGMGMHG